MTNESTRLGWQKTRTFVLCAFAVVGFFDLIGRLFLVYFTGSFLGQVISAPVAYGQIASLTAPDGKEKAVLYVFNPLGSGCNQLLTIVTSDIPDRIAWQERHRVFTTGCSDQLSFFWETPAGGRVKPRLRVNAKAASGDLMRRYALGGSVAVAYEGDP